MLDFKPQKPNVKKRKFNIGTNPSKKTNLVEVEQIITTKITNNPVNQPVDDEIPDERTENPNKPKRFVIGSNSNNSNNNTNNKNLILVQIQKIIILILIIKMLLITLLIDQLLY